MKPNTEATRSEIVRRRIHLAQGISMGSGAAALVTMTYSLFFNEPSSMRPAWAAFGISVISLAASHCGVRRLARGRSRQGPGNTNMAAPR